jgi:hypothetical protein
MRLPRVMAREEKMTLSPVNPSVAMWKWFIGGVAVCAAAAGCNMPSLSATEEQSGAPGAAYATQQSALEGEGDEPGVAEDQPWEHYAGCGSGAWYVCMGVNLRITWYSPPGEVTYSMKPGSVPCVEVQMGAANEDIELSNDFELAIGGKTEDDSVVCTFRGGTTVSVKGLGHCEGSPDRGALFMAMEQTWGDASATLSCKPKHEGGNVMPETIVPLGTLGTQQFYLDGLLIQRAPHSECRTFPIPGGPITGEISFCLTDSPYTEVLPLVPPPAP